MATPELLTYMDVVDTCVDFLSGHTASSAQRDIRRAIQSALRHMAAQTSDNYRQTRGRLHLVAPYTTGTITYVHTGGSSERLVTLSDDGTWPDWAADASIKIGDIISDVESRLSDSTITLDSARNPGADVAAGTSYTLYKTCYHLPNNFVCTTGFLTEPSSTIGRPVSLDEYFQLERYDTLESTPRVYAIGGVQDLYGTNGLYIWPAADEAVTFDYMYERMPRPLLFSGHDVNDSVGSIVIEAGTPTVVTGTDTAFREEMVGSIIRLTSSTTSIPTGVAGINVYREQRAIASYTSSGVIGLDSAATERNGTKYVITDPIDLDRPFWDAFQARCLYEIAMSRNMAVRDELRSVFEEKMYWAKCSAKKISLPPAGSVPHERRWVLTDPTPHVDGDPDA